MSSENKIAVVVPTYKAKQHVGQVIEDVPSSVTSIFIVDDACPQGSGKFVVENYSNNPRVTVLFHEENKGVGGATLTGFNAAAESGHDIFVKIDSDGQIDPKLVDGIVARLEGSKAGYVKGSRFQGLEYIGDMPKYRIFLNSVLSITNKFASGYYSLTDPTNGLVAIHRNAFEKIRKRKVAERYFFESDMLFHLNIGRVKVSDFPMRAHYGDEESGLSLRKEAFSFAFGNIGNFFRRIFIRHFLLNFSIPAIYLIGGLAFSTTGFAIGLKRWLANLGNSEPLSAGAVILPVLLLIVGLNMLTSFLIFDVNDEPK